MNDESSDELKASPVPISATARRVLGVLVEKAKTTPDNYPLTLTGIVTGSNQKSNRDPKMDLDEDDALLALDERQYLNARLEKQSAAKTPIAPADIPDSNRTAVDQLLDRLETVTNRIDTLEKRLAELENSNSSS